MSPDRTGAQPNRPFERPGINTLNPPERAWAGRSTPIR